MKIDDFPAIQNRWNELVGSLNQIAPPLVEDCEWKVEVLNSNRLKFTTHYRHAFDLEIRCDFKGTTWSSSCDGSASSPEEVSVHHAVGCMVEALLRITQARLNREREILGRFPTLEEPNHSWPKREGGLPDPALRLGD